MKVYGSMFNVRMGKAQNAQPVFNVWEQLCDNHSKARQNAYRQKPLLFYYKNCCYSAAKMFREYVLLEYTQ